MSLKMSQKWPKNGYREQPYYRTIISVFNMLNPACGLKLPRLEAETGKQMKIGQNLADKNRPIFGLFGNGI